MSIHLLAQGIRQSGGANPAFVTTWDTTKAGVTASNAIRIPLISGSSYNFHVAWGDGNEEDVVGTTLTQKDHTYASSGIYTVTITGTFPRIYFNNGGDRLKLLTVENWGNIVWSSMDLAFYGCSNLVFNATDVPDTSTVTGFYTAWRGCSSLTSFPLLNVSAGTDFYAAWFGCSSLTSFPLLNVSAGTNFSYAWHGCSSLTSFPLLNVSAGTNFFFAWTSCSGLTSFPLLNVSAGTNFSYAWASCSGLTTLATGFGSNCGAGTNFANAFSSVTLSTASYNQFLVELEAANQNNNVSFHGGFSKHSGAGTTARTALINDHTWTVTDGGSA